MEKGLKTTNPILISMSLNWPLLSHFHPSFFQVSRTKKLARAKVLREALDYKPDDLPDDPRYGPLKEGAYHLATADMEWTEREITKMMVAKENGEKESKREMERFLFPPKKVS